MKGTKMDDLISRQAAIDYLMTNMAWYDEDGCEESEDVKLSAITDLINGVPPAEDYKTDHGYMWICPECGLIVHSDFLKCVRCGHER